MTRLSAISVVVLIGCNVEPPDEQPRDLGEPVTVVQRGVQVCPAPGDRAALGPYERRQTDVPRPTEPWIWHGGVVSGDFNQDGYVDIVIALEQGVGLFEGLPAGGFVDRGDGPFGGADLSYASGGSAADYDGDGDLDLYITRIAGDPAPEGGSYGVNRLLRNTGGVFDDVTLEAEVTGCGLDHRDGLERCFRSMASSWADYDRDGDLDLYVGNYGFVDETEGTRQEDMEPAERDFLYRNEGDGTFTDLSELLPVEFHEGYTYAGGFVDFDLDGFPDLYTVNDFGNRWPNRVLWNDGLGGYYFDPDDNSGLVKSMTGMGLGVGDLNGDGWPDVAIPEWKRNTLLESRAEARVWIDVAQAKGFVTDQQGRGQQVGWGTLMGDVDNDGDLDILSQFGHVVNDNKTVWDNLKQQADALYLNDGNGEDYTFTDVAVEWGVADPGMSRGAVLADLNNDGYLDIAKRILDANDAAYLSRCGAEGWARITLRQPGTMNTHAIGAVVQVRAGSAYQTQTIVAGGVGYASAPPLEAHFGFGDVDTIDEITVTWPDGKRTIVEAVPTRQKIEIARN